MSQRVLIVAAHADDEVLGAGGTIAYHVAAGDTVRVIIAADCRTVRAPDKEPTLNSAAHAAACMLGTEAHFLGWRGMTLDGSALPLIQVIETMIADFQPSVVYTHQAHDLNSDHRAVSSAVMVATRPFCAHMPERVLHFEIPSSTGWETPSTFSPNYFVQINESMLEKKLAAMTCYAEELRTPPHPRSEEGLRTRAMYWGQQCGVRYAEPFMLMREVRTVPYLPPLVVGSVLSEVPTAFTGKGRELGQDGSLLRWVTGDGLTEIPEQMKEDLHVGEGAPIWFLKDRGRWQAYTEQEVIDLFHPNRNE